MLNNLMNIINGLEIRDMNKGITPADINEYNLVTIRSNDILGMYGMAVAGMFLANPCMVGKENVHMIILDDTFYEFSESTKSFIIAHELGHIQHEPQYDGYVRKIKDEFEADEHAAKLIGVDNTIKALEDLKDMFINDYFCEEDDDCVIEINARIENILNKNMVLC